VAKWLLALFFRRRDFSYLEGERNKNVFIKKKTKKQQQQKKLEIDPVITADIICNLVCDINDLMSCIKKSLIASKNVEAIKC